MNTFKRTAISSAMLTMLGHGSFAFAQSNALQGTKDERYVMDRDTRRTHGATFFNLDIEDIVVSSDGFFRNGEDPANDLFCGLFGEIEAVTLLNASISFVPAGSNVSYFLNAENLTDKQYIAARTNGIQPGRQRQVVAGINVKF